MKNLVLTAAFTVFAGAAAAQMGEVDGASLQLFITSAGHECAEVVNVEPVGNTGAKITCVAVAGNTATNTYDLAIAADGLTITKE